MPSAEHEGAGAVEGVEPDDGAVACEPREERSADKQQQKGRQRRDAGGPGGLEPVRGRRAAAQVRAEHEPGQRADADGGELSQPRRGEGDDEGGRDRNPGASGVGRQRPGHAEHRLGDYGDGHQLQTMNGALGKSARHGLCGEGETGHQDGGGQCETRSRPPGPPGDRPAEDRCQKPTWLEAGPGRNWQRATRSAKAVSSSQRRRTTKASRK